MSSYMLWAFFANRLSRIAFFSILILSAGCTKKLESVIRDASCSSRVSPTYNASPEPGYCSTSFTPSGGTINFTGTAYYRAWLADINGELTTASGNRPIRFAEVEIVDSTGQIVACTSTNGSGVFTPVLPSDLGNLTIRVKSRANDANELRASVLNCPEENKPYSLETTIDPTSQTSATLIAMHTGDVLGGAFNILDQFYEANEFLRTQVDNCGGDPAAECTSVQAALPKVQGYWAKGFNPNSYFSKPNSGVSFYLPGYSRLFILGGIAGDTDSSDTDHFDNSVVLHEYGHFLEDVMSKTDSPGGSHNGNSVIDPRLAWSEGFGNFIQAAITGISRYIDTKGNANGNADNFFNIQLETSVGCSSGCDIPTQAGEGNFREFSIARMLWDVFDNTGELGADGVNNEFLDLWRTMTSQTGLRSANEDFRNVGLVHDYQDRETASDWSSLRTAHMQNKTEDYARFLATGSCSAFTMNPVIDTDENYTIKNHFASQGASTYSNPLDNSDFYFIKHAGGTFNLVLNGSTTSGNESDLDLYVFNTDGRQTVGTDIVKSSYAWYDNNPSTPQTESVGGTLAAGNYLVRVLVYTGRNSGNTAWIDAGGPLTYTLTLNGAQLCPSATRP